MRNVFLEGSRIYLRPLEEEDLKGKYVSWLNDKNVNKYNSHHVFPYSLVEGLAYIRKSKKDRENLILAIVTKRGNVHIGNISLQNIDYINKNAEIAILIGEKKYRGKGYAKEAACMLTEHGFKSLGLSRIYCGTSSKNLSMRKLAESLNMTLEGKRRRAMFKDGAFVDIMEYGVLANEFKS